MSERHEQDPFGSLVGGAAGPVDSPVSNPDRASAAAEPDGSRSDAEATPNALPSRRALRAAREAEALAARSTAGPAPAIPVPAEPARELAPTIFDLENMPDLQPASAQLSFSSHLVANPATPRPRALRPTRRRRIRLRTSSSRVAEALGRRETRSKLSAAGAMLAITGMVAVVALPVYAAAPDSVDGATSSDVRAAGASAQDLVVAGTAQVETAKRDEFGATSAADLQRIYANALRQQNMQAYLASGAGDLGDDYPWFAELSDNQGGGLSPLNYYYRECVDFVAWRLNRDKGYTSAPFPINWSSLGAGSAYSWKSAWEGHGWTVSSTPVAGSVAYFAGQNHVAYVTGVLDNGDVLLEEYNFASDHLYGQRVISASAAVYLYAPPIG